MFLRTELKLELSPEKTLITRPDKEKIKFLGAYIKLSPKGWITKRKSGKAKRASLSNSGKGTVRLEAPITDLMNKRLYGKLLDTNSIYGRWIKLFNRE